MCDLTKIYRCSLGIPHNACLTSSQTSEVDFNILSFFKYFIFDISSEKYEIIGYRLFKKYVGQLGFAAW